MNGAGMTWNRDLERFTLRSVARAIAASKKFLLQQMPLGIAHPQFLGLWRHWTAGNPKGNDLDTARLAFLMLNIEAIEHDCVRGAFAELGVWRGNSAKVIHSLAPSREFYLLDTFDGFAQQDMDADPGERIGLHFRDASVSRARAVMGSSPCLHFIVGRFPDTAVCIPSDERFAFVHIDCDLYPPVKAGLEWFYPRMSAKGLIVVHDYASGRWPGVRRAVDEFLEDKPERAILIPDTSGSVAIACYGENVPRAK